MATTPKFVPGTFIRIPLADGSFGYGRILSDPYVALYNYRTLEPSADVDVIGIQPILFTQAVRHLGQDRWINIGRRELVGDVAKPVVRFRQDVADFRNCTIFDSEGMRRQVAPEECVGLERASVWDPHHIERRLLDAFMGRPNEDEIRARVRLS